MLHYEAHKNLKDITTGECNRIVIYNELHDPVALVIQIGKGSYVASNIGNSDFDKLVKAFNIDKLEIKNEN